MQDRVREKIEIQIDKNSFTNQELTNSTSLSTFLAR